MRHIRDCRKRHPMVMGVEGMTFFFSSRRRHTISKRDWSSDVCSSDLADGATFELDAESAPDGALGDVRAAGAQGRDRPVLRRRAQWRRCVSVRKSRRRSGKGLAGDARRGGAALARRIHQRRGILQGPLRPDRPHRRRRDGRGRHARADPRQRRDRPRLRPRAARPQGADGTLFRLGRIHALAQRSHRPSGRGAPAVRLRPDPQPHADRLVQARPRMADRRAAPGDQRKSRHPGGRRALPGELRRLSAHLRSHELPARPDLPSARRARRQDLDLRGLDARRLPRRAQRVQPSLDRRFRVQLRLLAARVLRGASGGPDAGAERIVLMRLALLASLIVALCGCPSNLEEQSHVSKLRALAVRADPPELVFEPDAGAPAATLTALAVEPGDASVTVQFALCKEITGTPSPTLPCPGDAGIELPSTGPVSARLDLAEPSIVAFASAAQLDAGLFDGGAGIEETLGEGVPLLIGFTARTASERLDGFSILILRSDARGPADENPELNDFLIADGGLIVTREVVRLQPVPVGPDDPPKVFSFFATAGSVSSLRSTNRTVTGQPAPIWVEWTAPDPTPAAPVRLWVVVRDEQGGTAWAERSAHLQ